MATYRMLFILSIILPMNISAQCILTPDSENVVGTQLAGDWQINEDLTTQLCPDCMTYWGDNAAVSFTDNPSIVDMLPEYFCESLPDDNILFMAGEITRTIQQDPDSRTYHYVLTSSRGNPFVLVFDGEGGSFNLMIARAQDKNNDILFTGGDHNNHPFSAWTRV